MDLSALPRMLLAGAVAITLGACGGGGIAEPGAASSTYDGSWELVEGKGPEGEVAIIKGYRVTLTIQGEKVDGTAACNSYFGDATIDGTSFTLAGVGATEMGCRGDVMDAQHSFITALTSADRIERDDDTLTLTGPKTELRFELELPVPTADLVGTRWELETLFYGTDDDGIATSASPAFLLLKADGTLTGTTGCRDLYGEWTEDGDEISFTTFGAEGKCSPDLKEQDDHVVTVLGDGFTVEIEENALTVVSQGDLGLGYLVAN